METDTWTYLRLHGPFTEKVSKEGFAFNKHGVCKNPELVFEYKTKKLQVEIYVCCCNGWWDYGFSFMRNSCGGMSPAMHPGPSRDEQKRFSGRPIYNRKFNATKQLAAKEAFEHIQDKYCSRAYTEVSESQLEVLREQFMASQTPQLSLF